MQDIIAQAILDQAPAETATEAPVTETTDATAAPEANPEAAEVKTETDTEAKADEGESKPKGEPKPDAKPAKVDETALFSDEALATPEGVKAAAEHLRATRRDVQKREFVIGKRQDKLREKVHSFAAEKESVAKEKETLATFAQRLQQDVAALSRGSSKEIMSTLGRLTGRDPIELYREMSMLMASEGKTNGKTSPELEAIRKELADLKAERETAQVRAQEAAQAQAIEAAKDRIFTAASDAGKFPSIARFVSTETGGKAEVREYLADWIVERYNATGLRPSDEEAAQDLERRLLAVTQPAGSTGAQTAKSATGQAPSNPATKPAVSLTSNDVSAPAQRKPRTEGYSTEELAADESFMSALF